jgi:hypothetical protein
MTLIAGGAALGSRRRQPGLQAVEDQVEPDVELVGVVVVLAEHHRVTSSVRVRVAGERGGDLRGEVLRALAGLERQVLLGQHEAAR